MVRPTLSVVMPNYNHAASLPDAIEGVLRQTRPADEFLILDDGSTDNSVHVIESYARRCSYIRFLRNEKNTGVIAAHRRLFSEARGDYICTAPADDVHLPRYFELGMAMAEAHPQAGIIFGQWNIIAHPSASPVVVGVRKWTRNMYATPEQFLREYLEIEAPSHSASLVTIYRADAFREVDWYRPELGSWSDTFAARAIGLKYGACYVAEPLSEWHRRRGSYSGVAAEDPRHLLDLVARAAGLMRSDEFRDRFPEEHVKRWVRRYRRLIIFKAWTGRSIAVNPRDPLFWLKMLGRLPWLPAALSLAYYQPTISATSSESA